LRERRSGFASRDASYAGLGFVETPPPNFVASGSILRAAAHRVGIPGVDGDLLRTG